MECWTRQTVSSAIATNLGQFNISGASGGGEYPVAFKAIPVVTASACGYSSSTTYSLTTFMSGAGSTTATPYICAGRPASAAIESAINIVFNIYAVGTWK